MAAKNPGTALAAINAQIAALQAKADTLRRKEVADVIERIKGAIEHYKLTAEDLGLVGRKGRKAVVAKADTPAKKPRKNAAVKKPAGVIKYTDGAGNSWTGKGTRPGWFKAAIAAGKTAEDLLANKVG
jgi:DNA-binding protein H-NS